MYSRFQHKALQQWVCCYEKEGLLNNIIGLLLSCISIKSFYSIDKQTFTLLVKSFRTTPFLNVFIEIYAV